MNTRSEQEQIEHLLTRDKFYEWYFKHVTARDLLYLLEKHDDLTLSQIYLLEMGLSTDSVIKGL